MRTSLRKLGNSRCVLIPAALLTECGISDEIDLHLEGKRIVIEPVNSPRSGWFREYQADLDPDAWPDLLSDAENGEWEW